MRTDRHRVGNFAGIDEARGSFIERPVKRLEEVFRPEDVGHLPIGDVVDQNGAE
jgi:hypothetical protein